MSATDDKAWLRRLAHRPNAPLRLLCMPPAGGGLQEYQHWPADLPNVEIWGAALPGRAERYSLPASTSVHESAAAIVDSMLESDSDWVNREFALFGHSFGSLLAFEVAREFRRRADRVPLLLAVSGYRGANQPVLERLHELPQAELFSHISYLWGGELPGGPQMMAAIEPALRADLACCANYKYVREAPMDCNLSVFGAHTDPLVSSAQLLAWKDLTSRCFRLRKFPGGHFYVMWHRRLLLRLLSSDIEDALATRGQSTKN